MRILIWHGYLLGGTGSNVFTRQLARALSNLGHDVTVICHDPDPGQFDLGTATVVRPDPAGPLPVFVLDRYPDMTPVLLRDLSQADRDRFVERAAAAIRGQGPADFLIANHILLGAPVGAASGLPFAVVAHGSELEYAMNGNRELCDWAARCLGSAHAVIAGSGHVVERIRQIVGPGDYERRIRVLPPGVDVTELRPQPRPQALRDLIGECRLDPPNPGRAHERLPDPGNADRLAEFLHDDQPTVAFVGKISNEKGVPLLLEAMRHVDARTVVAGFGPLRAELESSAPPDVLFTGPLEHRHLAHLWPLADVSVMPSVFPEAFCMVAAEAAACGSPPLMAFHAGLAEVATALAGYYPPTLRQFTSFRPGDAADLAAKIEAVIGLPDSDRALMSASARQTAVELWSLESVAARLIDIMTTP